MNKRIHPETSFLHPSNDSCFNPPMAHQHSSQHNPGSQPGSVAASLAAALTFPGLGSYPGHQQGNHMFIGHHPHSSIVGHSHHHDLLIHMQRASAAAAASHAAAHRRRKARTVFSDQQLHGLEKR